jgi:hypothetical protein
VLVKKGDTVQKARLVYDYQGKVAKQEEEDDGLAYGD